MAKAVVKPAEPLQVPDEDARDAQVGSLAVPVEAAESNIGEVGRRLGNALPVVFGEGLGVSEKAWVLDGLATRSASRMSGGEVRVSSAAICGHLRIRKCQRARRSSLRSTPRC
jgi:hypothetical protein